jgi:two-component system sensor histidine kinase ChiS
MTLGAISLLCLLITTVSARGKIPADGELAVNGTADISAIDTEINPANLNGEWEFYWGRLLEPRDFAEKQAVGRAEYIKVPGAWMGARIDNADLPGDGYATYRLKILNGAGKDIPSKISSLTVSGICSAYKLWINGTLVADRGVVDTSETARAQFLFVHHEKIVNFQLQSGMNEIVVQVLNYHLKSGGMENALKLGDSEAALRKQLYQNTADMIVVTLLFFVSMYNILLFLFNRKDRAALYLGLFSLVWTINLFNLLTPVINDYFSDNRFPYLLDVITIMMNGPLFLMAIQALYPKEIFPGVFPHVLRLSQIIAAVAAILVLLSGFKTSEMIISIYYYYSIAVMVYSAYVFIRILHNRRDEAALFSIGFFSFFIVSINDILFTLNVINTGFVFQYGMLVFCFSTSLVVSRRFARALRKVDYLTGDLREKNLALIKMDKLKNEFLANTSHELRTPLHGMIGLTESMMQGTAGKLPEKAVENLSLIASSGHRLAGMVNDLLDMAKIEDEQMSLNLRPVDLFSLTEMVIKLSRPLADKKPIEIINGVQPEIPAVMADEERIRQVMHNLVGNAVKFSNKGSIRISASVIDTAGAMEIPDRMIEIRVTDTGIGIPEEYRESIFEPYRQVDGGDARQYPGTGLGLAIAKKIVELHNGTIRVISGNHGSVFAFTLPVSHDPAAHNENDTGDRSDKSSLYGQEEKHSAPVPGSDIVFENNPVILVVDDDPVNVRVLQNYLELKRCTVKTTFDGISALDIIDGDKSIDLVLLDLMMPGMSGYEVCTRVRMKHPAEVLPVIMLTAKNMMSDINAAFEAGANDYIVKPFLITELLARVNTMLKLKSIRRSEAESITIQAWNNLYSLKFGDIIYISSHSRNITVHTVEQDLELPVLMKEIINQLPPDIFIRIHKSYIVNINYIYNLQHVISGRYRVRLKDDDDTDLPVGPSFLEDVRKKIQDRT